MIVYTQAIFRTKFMAREETQVHFFTRDTFDWLLRSLTRDKLRNVNPGLMEQRDFRHHWRLLLITLCDKIMFMPDACYNQFIVSNTFRFNFGIDLKFNYI